MRPESLRSPTERPHSRQQSCEMTESFANAAVLACAVIMLVAIFVKLVTAHLVARHKKNFNSVDQDRREINSRLKQAEMARTSARGTVEFWTRRRLEVQMRVQEAIRDIEAYEEQFGEFDEAAQVFAEEQSGSGVSVAPDDDTADSSNDAAESPAEQAGGTAASVDGATSAADEEVEAVEVEVEVEAEASDEPADIVREIGIHFSYESRRALLEEILENFSSPDSRSLCDDARLMYSKFDYHDMSFDKSCARLYEKLDVQSSRLLLGHVAEELKVRIEFSTRRQVPIDLSTVEKLIGQLNMSMKDWDVIVVCSYLIRELYAAPGLIDEDGREQWAQASDILEMF